MLATSVRRTLLDMLSEITRQAFMLDCVDGGKVQLAPLFQSRAKFLILTPNMAARWCTNCTPTPKGLINR